MWSIPAPRTKGNREHRVPLCRRALEILEEARAIGRSLPLVFPGVGGKPIGNTALSELAQGVERRGGAARLPVELSGTGRRKKRIILARWRRLPWRTRSRSQIEAAYRRSDLFERRPPTHGGLGRLPGRRVSRGGPAG